MNFKSKAAYNAWLKYGHASGEFAKTPGNQPVSIQGKSHGVQHAFGGEMYAAGGSFNNPGFAKLPKDVQAKIKARSFADGGPMAQLTEFNEGGRHEENPIGGIPQGFAPDGQPNLVEQGETKLNSDDYIYSDTLKVTKDIALDFSLPKNSVGKTFAQVSKEANRPKSRRENDTIEQVAIKRDLDNLMQAQEEFKKRDLEKDMQMMMEKHPQEMQQMMAGAQMAQQGMPQEGMMPGQEMQGPPQEMAPEQQVPQSAEMGMPQGQPVDPNQIPPEMLAQMQGAQQGAPVMRMGGNIYMCGGKMYDFGGWVDDNSSAIGQGAAGAASGAMSGAAIGGATTGPFAWLGAPAGAIIGGAIGGVSGVLKGHKKDKAEQIAEEEANKTKILERQALNAAMALPDTANIVQTPNRAIAGATPMNMSGVSFANGGWMDDNSSAIGGAGTGAMTGLESGMALGANFGPYGELIGGIGGLLGGAALGGIEGHKQDEADAKKEQEFYDAQRAQRQQYNMALNAPQMYQGYQNPLQNVGAFPTTPSGSMSYAKYGGRQYDAGGKQFTKEDAEAIANRKIKSSTFGATHNIGVPPPGGPLANRSDSLAVSNNARAVHNYYRDNGYERYKIGIGKGGMPLYGLDDLGSNPWKSLEQARKNVEDRTNKKTNITPSPVGITSKKPPMTTYYSDKPYTQISQYAKTNPANSNQFWQREMHSGVLDMNAPMTFYDKRIQPQTWDHYSHYSNGDEVTVPAYDPIAVAPWDTLNEKERAYRIKNFGWSGVPTSVPGHPGKTTTTKPGTKTTTTPPAEEITTEPGAQPVVEDMTIGTLPLNPIENIPLNGPSPQEMVWIRQYQHPEKNIFGNPKRGQEGYYTEKQVVAGSDEANRYFSSSQHSPDSIKYFQDYPMYDAAGHKVFQNQITSKYAEIPKNRQFTTEGAYPYGTQPAETFTPNIDEPTSLNYAPIEGMKVNPVAGVTFEMGGFLDSNFSMYGSSDAHSFGPGGPLVTVNPETGATAKSGYHFIENPAYDEQLKIYNDYQAQLAIDPNYNPAPTVPMGTVGSAPLGPGDHKWLGKRAPEKYFEIRIGAVPTAGVINENETAQAIDLRNGTGIIRTDAYGKRFKYNLQGQKVYIDNSGNPINTVGTEVKTVLTDPGTGATTSGTGVVTDTTPATTTTTPSATGTTPAATGTTVIPKSLAYGGSLFSMPNSYAYGDKLTFEGDPIKGDTRINEFGNKEVYNGTEWELVTTPDPDNDREAQAQYESDLKSKDEKLKDRTLNLEMNQSLPEFLAVAAPAAYNLGQGIFGKVQQLRPQDYMVAANMKPYQYNIDPQLRAADQSFAQGQEALRNAGLGGGNYATNMQQLANSRNQAIGGLYTEKQNADAASYNQAMAQNKAIESENLQRRMGVEDFNRQAKAAKTAMLQAGLQQLAQVSEGSQAKKIQIALMQALAPEFANTMAYNSIADQYLNLIKDKIKEKKESKKTKG